MIKVEKISKHFGKNKVLSEVSFFLEKGTITALIGENGAGKSTLIRTICGYLPVENGKIEINQYDIEKNRIEALKNIGYVPEISSLYNQMITYDFLVWIAQIWKVDEPKNAIINICKKLDIMDILDKRIAKLSKGFKKRVEIAAALLHEPEFLVLDEPTDGLDPKQKKLIRQFITQYAKKHTILISTHIMEDTCIADHIIMLQNGSVIKNTDLDDFKKTSKENNVEDAFVSLVMKKENN